MGCFFIFLIKGFFFFFLNQAEKHGKRLWFMLLQSLWLLKERKHICTVNFKNKYSISIFIIHSRIQTIEVHIHSKLSAQYVFFMYNFNVHTYTYVHINMIHIYNMIICMYILPQFLVITNEFKWFCLKVFNFIVLY